MLSSLFPRSSIYKDLDDDRHNHGFDTDNTALFSADEHLEDDEAVASADHAATSAGMTGRQFGHRYQASLSDPFEKVPKTGTMLPQLPLIPSGSAGPSRATSPSERDRGRKQAVENSQVAPRSSMDPFAGADVYTNDPMAALSQRLNNPFGSQQRPEAGLDGDHLHDEDQHREEEEPPKSMCVHISCQFGPDYNYIPFPVCLVSIMVALIRSTRKLQAVNTSLKLAAEPWTVVIQLLSHTWPPPRIY